jgi:hypothetical protein
MVVKLPKYMHGCTERQGMRGRNQIRTGTVLVPALIEGVAIVIIVTTNLEHLQLQRSDTELIHGRQRLQLVFKRF